MRIDACFDSHVHWAATGEFAQRLRLEKLSSAASVTDLKAEPQHFRGEWLLGFGWDDNAWADKPSRALLDKTYPDRPVAFERTDGHAYWVNSEALKRAGISERDTVPGGRIEWDLGLLVDRAMEPIDKQIPQMTSFDVRRNMMRGMKTFNDAGFTHIRDMTCDETQWHEAMKLDQSGVLTMAVEEYFWLKSASDLDSVLATLKAARASQGGNLRVMGAKVFLDGALGSEGAWLSNCYCGRQHKGLQLWEEQALRETMIKLWENDFHVAAHAIGDAAAAWIVDVASTIEKRGVLHIEHGELIRPATIEKMKPMKVEVHMQPCHWLSDRKWLEGKIGKDLMAHAFPWRRLQEAEIHFDFGSDAPIEPPSVARTFEALRESADAGIPRLLGMPSSYMSHRDLSWAPNTFTQFQEGGSPVVVFRGEHLS